MDAAMFRNGEMETQKELLLVSDSVHQGGERAGPAVLASPCGRYSRRVKVLAHGHSEGTTLTSPETKSRGQKDFHFRQLGLLMFLKD
ncbi:hypothetical protein E2C01_070498 [Portunus trituberculatus]|uniref:Uncharacterized protein n=1 Tax=Portunus trituberculatus TaxID=210409 RepID=A0A5B7I5L0_PORTR|nr:hypothetical protein [Portunus trituberculatus]